LQQSSDPEDISAMGGGRSVGENAVGQAAVVRKVAPSRRFGYVSVVHQGKFVLFGGFDVSAKKETPSSAVTSHLIDAFIYFTGDALAQ
jgi:hypothetical protein